MFVTRIDLNQKSLLITIARQLEVEKYQTDILNKHTY